jgi:NADP-reducing hydrogenase subunit HndD
VEAYKFLEGVTVKVAVTSGLKGANQLMEQVRKGESPYHFIEVMGCPGGCITGGGQPRSSDPEVRMKRLKGLYNEDEGKTLRKSHENPYVTSIYKDFLDHPCGHKSHELLHTHYVKRGIYNELTEEGFVSVPLKPAKKGKAMQTVSQDKDAPVSSQNRKVHEINESEKVLALEAENARLKNELEDSLETVDIFKRVIADYTNKHK